MFKNILAFMLILTFFPTGKAMAKSGDWGMSFPKPGEKPVGNENAEYLKKFDAYFVGEGDEKVVYLTFDAGYENGYTTKILDVLKEKKVPAAFFLVGTYIRDNPALTERMVQEGHIVGNHTMSHPDMSKISSKESFMKELSTTEELYKTLTGLEMPKYYRPPRGKYSESNMQMAKDLGYKTVFWSMAYRDWENDKQPTKEEAFSKLIPRLHPGAILLLHTNSKTNSEILGELIDSYHKAGYEFKSLDDLVK